MYIKPSRNTKRSLLFFVLICAVAGFINGLLGAGGGILLVWAFSRCIGDESTDGIRDTFASTLAAVLPITAVSAWLYGRQSLPAITELSPLVLPGIAGGVLGALLLGKFSTSFLKKLFAVLVLYSGISMVLL